MFLKSWPDLWLTNKTNYSTTALTHMHTKAKPLCMYVLHVFEEL